MLRRLEQYKDEIYFYYIAFLVIFIPLYPKFPFINIPGSQVALRIEDLLISIAFILMILVKRTKIFSLFKNKIVQAIILFWVAGLVSSLSALMVTQTVSPLIVLLHWGRRVEYMVMFILGFMALRSKKDLIFILKSLVLVISYLTIYAVGQKYFSWPVIVTQNSEYAKGVALRWLPGGHLVSTFAGHYDMATYLIMVSPIFYGLLLNKKARNQLSKNRFTFVLLIGICIFVYWLLVNAASRISIVSYLGAITLMMIFLRKIRYIAVFLFLSFIFLWTSSNLIDRYIRIFRVAMDRYITYEYLVDTTFAATQNAPERREPSTTPLPASINIIEDRSTSIRLNVEWPRAIRAVLKNPLLGTGYSSISLATDNDYLRMLGETGVIGTMAFFLIVIRILKRIIFGLRKLKLDEIEKVFVLGIFASLFGISLNMVFIDILEASKFAIIFWLFLGLVCSVIANYEINKNN